jgi:hypothetical protein
MPSIDDISGKIRATLRLTDPDLDTSIGTPTRKIVDAVSEAIAEASTDGYLIGYQYDIDTKAGSDLDDFVKLFGFSRLPARRGTGLVTFDRTEPATQPIVIPTNTQLITDALPQVVIGTVTPAVFSVGSQTITVPAQAIQPGSQGNIVANSVGRALSPVQGVSAFTNPQSFTGGADAESDASLRDRFKKTLFRSMAGTEAMYLGTALEHPNVTQASVVGAVKRHREQIQIVAGSGTSTIAGASYIYPGTSAFGVSISDGLLFNPVVHYTFTATNPPTISITSSSIVPDGIYDLEFDFLSSASRNDPVNNITNRVDLWCRGERITAATETMIFDQGRVFNNTVGSDYLRTNFRREDETTPTTGNYLIPFGFAPVVDAAPNNTMLINGVTYTKNTHFWLVQDVTPRGMSNRGYSGVELLSTANGLVPVEPPNNQHFNHSYLFDSTPRDVEASVQRWRMVTQDLWVHQARKVLLRVYLAAIFVPGFNTEQVGTDVYNALRAFSDSVAFEGILQASDLLAVAHGVAGIDSVRFLTSTENAVNYAIQRVDAFGAVKATYASGGRAQDVFATDDTVLIVDAVQITAKAQNTWNTV